MERKIGTRQIIFILSLFLIAQFIGLLLVIPSYSPSYSYANNAVPQQGGSVSFFFWFIIDIIIIILVLMLVLRYYKGNMFFRLLEAYIIIFGSFFFFMTLINDILPAIAIFPLSAISLFISLALLAYKIKFNKMRNLITLITSIGAGIFIGANIGIGFGFLTLYLLIGLFAVYDYLAVFVLKFMIPFAQEASKRNLAFMIGSTDLELSPSKSKKRMKKEDLEKIQNPEMRYIAERSGTPSISAIMLGNGDIMLPMTLAVGSYMISGNLFISMMIITGAGAGLIFTIFLLRKYKIGLPAIPPLFAFMSAFLSLAFLISKPRDPSLSILTGIVALVSLLVIFVTLRKISKKKFEE